MAAPKGNSYWMLRSRSGRYLDFENPDMLMDEANKYFEWVQNNPLMSSEVVKYKDYAELIEVPKMRPFTLEGLCNFLEITVEGFKKYEKREDFVEVTTRIRQVIYNQKFEGAASGFLNPNIIARDLGLQDKQQTEHTGEIIVRPPKFE